MGAPHNWSHRWRPKVKRLVHIITHVSSIQDTVDNLDNKLFGEGEVLDANAFGAIDHEDQFHRSALAFCSGHTQSGHHHHSRSPLYAESAMYKRHHHMETRPYEKLQPQSLPPRVRLWKHLRSHTHCTHFYIKLNVLPKANLNQTLLRGTKDSATDASQLE